MVLINRCCLKVRDESLNLPTRILIINLGRVQWTECHKSGSNQRLGRSETGILQNPFTNYTN